MISLLDNLYSNDPAQAEVGSFAELEVQLWHLADDGQTGVWIAGPARGITDGHIDSIDYLTLDFDHGEPDWVKLAGFRYIAHTTRRHTPEAPRWRVILELEEVSPGGEWKSRYREWIRRHDLAVATDEKTCNPSRKWFLPSTAAQWRTNDGQPARLPGLTECKQDERARFESDDALLAQLKNEDPEVCAAALRYLEKEAPKPPEHKGGNNSLFEVARVLVRSFCLEPDLAAFLLEEYRAQHWTAPAQPGDIQRAVQRALSVGVDRPGQRLLDVPGAFERIAPPPPKAVAAPEPEVLALQESLDSAYAGLPFDDLTNLPTRVIRPTEWLCEGLCLARGVRPATVLSYPGFGKTTALASLALAVATGGKALGQFKCHEGRACIINNEDEIGMMRVLQEMVRAQQIQEIPAGRLVQLSDKICLTDARIQHLPRIFREYDLVIIDSLRAVSPGVNENETQFAAPLGDITRWAKEQNTCCLLARHTGKAAREDAGAGHGTSAVDGWTSVQWLLQGVDKNNPSAGIDWACIRRNGVESNGTWPQAFVSTYAHGVFAYEIRKAESASASEVETRVLKYLQTQWQNAGKPTADDRRQWHPTQEIKDRVVGKSAAISDALKRLRNTNRIEFKRSGKQELHRHRISQ